MPPRRLRARLPLPLLLVAAALAAAAPLAAARSPGPASDAALDLPSPRPAGEPRYPGSERRSFYLTMRDGVRIAVDLWLPEGLEPGARLPAILHQTRYWRSAQLRWPASVLFDQPFPEAQAFVRHGYAWLDVDVRGSGASFGQRPYPWSADETRDGAEIVDWVVAQPWSNGRVGTFGTSYDGTTAEFLVTTRHPAVRAAAPRFSLFDGYADIAFPGGLPLDWFTRSWGHFNGLLDRNQVPPDLREMLGWQGLLVRGVRPVDGEDGPRLLQEALRDHAANWDPHTSAGRTTFRDDRDFSGEVVDVFSPFTYADALDASHVPIWGWSGWFDGGYAHAAIKRHLTLRNPANRLILGPWDHGGMHQVRGGHSAPSEFDHTGQLLKFFDHYLTDAETGLAGDPPVLYYTLVEGRWKGADAWPPPAEPVRQSPPPGAALAPDVPTGASGSDRYEVDPAAATGPASRWNSLMGLAVDYPDRAAADARDLTYTSPPLDRDLEVTGHPVMTLYVASSAEDGAFFAYLEDVGPDGSVTYVSEGELRALHRKLATTPPSYRTVVPYRTYRRADGRPLRPGQVEELVFDLLPTSYLFRAGHAIRVSLAGADADHFARIPAGDPPTWEVQRSRPHPSHILLPVVEAAAPAP